MSPRSWVERKKRIQENKYALCPRLKLPDSPGDGQKTRGCLFASSGPLSEEAPRIHRHANRPGQIPVYTGEKLRDSHTHTHTQLSTCKPVTHTLVISSSSSSASSQSLVLFQKAAGRRRSVTAERYNTRGGTRGEGRVEEFLPLRGGQMQPRSRSLPASPPPVLQISPSPLSLLSLMCQYAHMLRLLPRSFITLSLSLPLSLYVEAANQMRAEDRDLARDEWREDKRSAPPPPHSSALCHSL